MFSRSGRMEYRRQPARRSFIDLECIDKEQFRSQCRNPSPPPPLPLPAGSYSEAARFRLADAYSASATDRTPYNLQSPPASALSVAGGHCDATSPGSVFRNIFSWGPSVAQIQGDQKPDGTHRDHRNLGDPERPGSESGPECRPTCVQGRPAETYLGIHLSDTGPAFHRSDGQLRRACF